MIQIYVHGIRSGYKVLNPKRNQFTEKNQFVEDNPDRLDVWDPSAVSPETHIGLGNFVYSIAFYKQKKVYTKTIIVKDGGGSGRIGTFNFAITLPWNKQMEGEDIRSILDEIHNHYRPYLEATDHTPNVGMPADWSFTESILDRYNSNNKIKKDDEALAFIESEQEPKQRSKAYAYYESSEELNSLLSAPYQKDFEPYLQIYFIDKQKKDQSDNPLKVLDYSRNADLTGKIKIIREKVEYTLVCPTSSSSLRIQVFKNNEGLKPGDLVKFGLNDSLKIIYSKENHESLEVKISMKNAGADKNLIFQQGSNSFRIATNVQLTPRYKVSAGEFGELSRKGVTSGKHDGSDVKHYIEPNPGYRFTGFELMNGVLIAQYEKKMDLKPFYLGGAVVMLCVMIFLGATYLFPPPPNEDNEIEVLLTNDNWLLADLEKRSNANCVDITKDTYNADECEKLQKAIAFRKLLNKGDFEGIIKQNLSKDPNMGQNDGLKIIIEEIVKISDKNTRKRVGGYLIKEQISTMSLSAAGRLIDTIKQLIEIEAAVKNIKSPDSLIHRRGLVEKISRPDSLKKTILAAIARKLGDKNPEPDPIVKGGGGSKGGAAGSGGNKTGSGSGGETGGDPPKSTSKEDDVYKAIRDYYNGAIDQEKLMNTINRFNSKDQTNNIKKVKDNIEKIKNKNKNNQNIISQCPDLNCFCEKLR